MAACRGGSPACRGAYPSALSAMQAQTPVKAAAPCSGPGTSPVLEARPAPRGLQCTHGVYRGWAGPSRLSSLRSQPAPGPVPAPPLPPAPARPGTVPATPSRRCSRLGGDVKEKSGRGPPPPAPPRLAPVPEDTDAKRHRADAERQQRVAATEPPLQSPLALGALHLSHEKALLGAEPRLPHRVDAPRERHLPARLTRRRHLPHRRFRTARRRHILRRGGAGGRIQSEGRGQRRLASAAAAAGAGRRAVGCEAQRAAEAHSDWPAGVP